MIYSFSEGRLFRKCQRYWFYSKRLASATAKARAEVTTALTNLFHSPHFQEIRNNIKSAYRITAQCPITFPYSGATIRAVPDLICLFRGAPPLIIDWKVHFFGVHDYYQQL